MSGAPPEKASVLVICYGNPGRRDDGLGPWIAEELERRHGESVTVEAVFQLAIELCVEIARHRMVLFVDAARGGPAPFRVSRLQLPRIGQGRAASVGFTMHEVSPAGLMTICQSNYNPGPPAWIIGVRGYRFGGGEGLSRNAERNALKTIVFLDALLSRGSEAFMAGTEGQTKTILLVDDDADVRATLRIVLESEGFTVGEAADGDAGMKIAERIRPDAIIVDLMMETVDAGSKVSTRLKASGFTCPIYLLSAAGDSVRYNIDTQELGLAGIFQKPADPVTLVATLKTRLQFP